MFPCAGIQLQQPEAGVQLQLPVDQGEGALDQPVKAMVLDLVSGEWEVHFWCAVGTEVVFGKADHRHQAATS